MEVKRKDNKHMVIHTKEKPKIHIKRKIKGRKYREKRNIVEKKQKQENLKDNKNKRNEEKFYKKQPRIKTIVVIKESQKRKETDFEQKEKVLLYPQDGQSQKLKTTENTIKSSSFQKAYPFKVSYAVKLSQKHKQRKQIVFHNKRKEPVRERKQHKIPEQIIFNSKEEIIEQDLSIAKEKQHRCKQQVSGKKEIQRKKSSSFQWKKRAIKKEVKVKEKKIKDKKREDTKIKRILTSARDNKRDPTKTYYLNQHQTTTSKKLNIRIKTVQEKQKLYQRNSKEIKLQKIKVQIKQGIIKNVKKETKEKEQRVEKKEKENKSTENTKEQKVEQKGNFYRQEKQKEKKKQEQKEKSTSKNAIKIINTVITKNSLEQIEGGKELSDSYFILNSFSKPIKTILTSSHKKYNKKNIVEKKENKNYCTENGLKKEVQKKKKRKEETERKTNKNTKERTETIVFRKKSIQNSQEKRNGSISIFSTKKSAIPVVCFFLFLLIVLFTSPLVSVLAVIYNSPFAILFPSISSTETTQEVVTSYQAAFDQEVNREMNAISGYNACIKMYSGAEAGEIPDNFFDILAVYMVKYGNGDTATDMTEQAKQNLKQVFDSMCSYSVSSQIQVVTDQDGNVVTTYAVKYVTITMKTYQEMIAVYGFDEEEQEILMELMKPENLAMMNA